MVAFPHIIYSSGGADNYCAYGSGCHAYLSYIAIARGAHQLQTQTSAACLFG